MKVLNLMNHPKFLKNNSGSNKNTNCGEKVIRFPVFYRVENKVIKLGDPGYCETYTPPAPYDKNSNSEDKKKTVGLTVYLKDGTRMFVDNSDPEKLREILKGLDIGPYLPLAQSPISSEKDALFKKLRKNLGRISSTLKTSELVMVSKRPYFRKIKKPSGCNNTEEDEK